MAAMAAALEYISSWQLVSGLPDPAVLDHSFYTDIQYAIFADYSGVGCDLLCYFRPS